MDILTKLGTPLSRIYLFISKTSTGYRQPGRVTVLTSDWLKFVFSTSDWQLTNCCISLASSRGDKFNY